jgi:hypothetical protein
MFAGRATGMVSSSMGMRELPYRELPLAIDGSALSVERVAARDDFPHALVLVSGVRSHDDVMRGEETQLIGACALGPADHAAAARIRAGAAIPYYRLDGSTLPAQRQAMIDSYNAPECPVGVFLLSPRAGGLGVNLQTADTIIIHAADLLVHLRAYVRATAPRPELAAVPS